MSKQLKRISDSGWDKRKEDIKRERPSTDSRDERHRSRKEKIEPKIKTEWDRQSSTSNETYSQKFGKKETVSKPSDKQKERPNFGLSGKLAEETNTYHGIVINYSEPPEAMKPKLRWRLYPFKGDETLPTLYIHRQSAYLIGRDRKVADMPVDHPSCSKQHAVIQYRLVNYTKDDGSRSKHIVPYIIDLGSTNGTYINNKRIDSQRYVELMEKDVIKFGFSSREYVMLHENSEGAHDSEKSSERE